MWSIQGFVVTAAYVNRIASSYLPTWVGHGLSPYPSPVDFTLYSTFTLLPFTLPFTLPSTLPFTLHPSSIDTHGLHSLSTTFSSQVTGHSPILNSHLPEIYLRTVLAFHDNDRSNQQHYSTSGRNIRASLLHLPIRRYQHVET